MYHAQRYGNTGSSADERVYSGYGNKVGGGENGRRRRLSVVLRLCWLIWVAVGASTKHKTCENTGNIMSKENWDPNYVYFLSKHAAITNNCVVEVRFCCCSNRQVGE